jgi:hypothetical protein
MLYTKETLKGQTNMVFSGCKERVCIMKEKWVASFIESEEFLDQMRLIFCYLI